MSRLLFFLFFLVSAGLGQPAAAQRGAEGLPPRPSPFQFVNDQGSLMSAGDAKKLESGLRRYADNTGTQVVVVTVPSLGGREVNDYSRALGEAWGVGQRDKNNGVVVLISKQDRKVAIQPGSGLQNVITPAVTQRVIGEMTPNFKQGNYFAGLRKGLSTLMLTANPDSNPQKDQAGATANAGTDALGASAGAGAAAQANLPQTEPGAIAPTDPQLASPPTEPVSSGPGMGTILLGALAVGGVIFFLVKMLRGRSAAANANSAAAVPNFRPGNGNANSSAVPNFLPNRPNGPAGNYGPGQQPQGNYNQGYNNSPNQGGGGLMGGGMGGILATGAAAAAGAYLGNRMASGHESSATNFTGDGNSHNLDAGGTAAAGLGGAGLGAAGAAGTGAAEDYFSGGAGAGNTAPDYFADDVNDNSQGDYFSADDSGSYDDLTSDDTGGGFDGDDDNSGSW
ncbi:MAG TPA: TPM domain-containing protein [Hymenobacter sp.]